MIRILLADWQRISITAYFVWISMLAQRLAVNDQRHGASDAPTDLCANRTGAL
jgi:hypothetical protein